MLGTIKMYTSTATGQYTVECNKDMCTIKMINFNA